MYFPAALAGASDWWRVSAIGVVAVSFDDDTSLAVFNSSYRILWICLIFIGSIGGALGVKVANFLGAGDVKRAKHTIVVALTIAAVLLTIFASIVLLLPSQAASIFTSDPVIHICLLLIFLCIFAIS
jgi:Na+-driven multidrug efflux pump